MIIFIPSLSQAIEREKERAKIDYVDTRDAPTYHVFTTYLKSNDRPVDPKTLENLVVFVDDVPFEGDVEKNIFKKLGWGIDLVFVLSVHGITLDDTAGDVLEAAATQLGLVQEADQVGVVIDNGKVLIGSKIGPADGAGEALGKVDPKQRGGGAFTYDAIEVGLGLFKGETAPHRKRVMIIVTDGADKSTWGGGRVAIEMFLQRSVKAAKEKNVQIFGVIYWPNEELDAKIIRLLTRKTGGTCREARTDEDVLKEFKATFGEIYGQIVFSFTTEMSEFAEYKFLVEMKRDGGKKIKTFKFKQHVGAMETNWKLVLIIAGSVLGLALLIGIIALIVKWLKKRKK